MKKILNIIFALGILFLGGCIGNDIIDDRVDPVVRITNPIDTIEVNSSYQFEASFFNNVGKQEVNNLTWKSSDENTISISSDGLATAHQIGNTIISVETIATSGEEVKDERVVIVGNSTVISTTERTGTLATTSSYALEGDFILKEIGGVLTLSFAANYKASTALPGLYAYLTNNPTTSVGAYEIGAVSVFEGVHSYELPSSIGLMDYEYVLYFCKPFNAKVGDGQFNN